MLYALTCGCHQQPVHAKLQPKKYQRLKYKQWKYKFHEGRYAATNKMILETEIPLDRFRTLYVNDCVYEGKTKEFIINWVHPLLLKDRYEDIKEDNPNWNQAMNGQFVDE